MDWLESFLKASWKLARRRLLWHFLGKPHKELPPHSRSIEGLHLRIDFPLSNRLFVQYLCRSMHGWLAMLPSNRARAQVAIGALHWDHHCEIRKGDFPQDWVWQWGTWLRIGQSYRVNRMVNRLWPIVNSFSPFTVLILGYSSAIIYATSCPKWAHEF